MEQKEDIIRDILSAADGEIVGRIRMQKIVYLLEQCGMEAGFDYSYYHYGPYSENLSITLERAQYLDKTIVEEQNRSDTGFYSIFRLQNENKETPSAIGKLGYERAKDIITKIKNEASSIAELAATIHWLVNEEKITDWKTELKRRKPAKATGGAIAQAKALLNEIDIPVDMIHA